MSTQQVVYCSTYNQNLTRFLPQVRTNKKELKYYWDILLFGREFQVPRAVAALMGISYQMSEP